MTICFARGAKVFSDGGIIQIPPDPPLEKGGTTKNCLESPPLKKGDLGGFENLQGERIYGKRYNRRTVITRPVEGFH
jgi:hypothetical protein